MPTSRYHDTKISSSNLTGHVANGDAVVTVHLQLPALRALALDNHALHLV